MRAPLGGPGELTAFLMPTSGHPSGVLRRVMQRGVKYCQRMSKMVKIAKDAQNDKMSKMTKS